MSTHDPHPDDRREREVIVTDRGRGGGVGTVIAAVIGLLVVLLVGWFLLTALNVIGDGDGGTTVDVPSEVNVDVDEGGGEG